MVYTTIDKLTNMMTEKSLGYFRVLDPTKEKIYDNDEVEFAKVANEVEKLASYLEELEGTFVFVRLSKDSFKGKNKGGDTQTGTYQYRVNLRSSSAQSKDVSGIGSQASKRYDDLLEKFNELKLQVLLRDNNDKWEQRIAAIEEKNGENPLEKYAPIWMPALAKIAGVNLPLADSTAAINGTETPDKSINDRLKDACVRLLKVDPDFANTLEALASFAEKNNAAYKQYIPMLKNM